MRGAIEEVPLGVATTRGGEILHANAALERIYGAGAGCLDGMPIEVLIDGEELAAVRASLDKSRVFDGRLSTRGVDGRAIHAEFHAERYTSTTDGVGGFLLVRDVTFEVGALGRLIDQLGGALFRIRTRDARIEHVSPAIERLTGVDAQTCMERPEELVDLVPPGERERVRAIYRRLARGELQNGSVEVTLRRPDGRTSLVQVRATGRRDTTGRVRQIEGVVNDVSSAASARALAAEHDAAHAAMAPPWAAEPRSGRFVAPDGLLEVTRVLLQETSTLIGDVTSEIGAMGTMLKATYGTMPPNISHELATSLATVSARLAAATALKRRLRRALEGRPSTGPLVNVFESVRTALSPVLGEHAVSVSAGDSGGVILAAGLDELALALIYLGLRAYRLGGAGMLRIDASHRRATLFDRRASRDVRIEVVGEPQQDNGMNAVDSSSGLLSTIPRHSDMIAAFDGAQALLKAVGASIESDDVTVHAARTIVRLVV